jgi:GAF domain-containing protein
MVSETENTIRKLADVSAACRAMTDDTGSAATVLEQIGKVVRFDAATLYHLDRGRNHLEEVVSLGRRVELLSFVSMGAGKGLSGWTAYHKRPILLSDRSTIGEYGPDSQFASFLSLPLQAGDDVIGVLNLGSTETNAFSPEDVTVLGIVADQMALALACVESRSAVQGLTDLASQNEQRLLTAQKGLAGCHRLEEVPPRCAAINNGINNALAVIMGNVQCLLTENMAVNQKAVFRLRRIEDAAQRISTLNRQVLELNTIVQACMPGDNQPHRVRATGVLHGSD